MAAITVERYFVVPHTHWDREWYRPFEHFRLLLGGVVDEVLDTLERDPAFTSFTLDGQAIVLEDYVEVRPEHEQRLRALIEAGRIEIGPSYVLPDEFLVGGEPLVRNLLIGRAVCERFGGRASPAGYLPDSFGHPMQLPQILAGFGIDSFLFSRGLGDELEELGVAFQWVAPDGSSVRALQLLGDYSNFAGIGDADDGEARVRGIDERFGWALERAAARDVLLCNGTDHTHVQAAMPAICAELERRVPGSSFEIAKYGDYVAGLRTGELPSWSGELLGSRLWNVLRGVNSARLYLKQANERAERRLLATETLAALCAAAGRNAIPAGGLHLGLAGAAQVPAARFDLRLLVRRGPPGHARAIRVFGPDAGLARGPRFGRAGTARRRRSREYAAVRAPGSGAGRRPRADGRLAARVRGTNGDAGGE